MTPELWSTAPAELESDAERQLQLLLGECSVIVGMHPDQATHPMVDAAIRGGKQWAVVPCCVFGIENQERLCPATGRPCENYGELVQYLKARTPTARTTFLKFGGRNQVIYEKHGAE